MKRTINPPTITIVVNGHVKTIPSGATIRDVLEEQQVRTALVAVELNLEIVPKSAYDEMVLKEGDQVEVVTLVGGG